MRERQQPRRRHQAPCAHSSASSHDNIELIELGEAEGDAGDRRRGRGRAARAAHGEAKRRQVETLLSGEADAQRHLSRGPCRRRRHREPGLGQDAAAHVHALGRAQRLQGRGAGNPRRRRGRHQVGDHPDQGPQRLWLAEDRSRACTAWCASRPIDSNARRHTSLRQRLGLSGHRRHDRDRDQRERLPHRHLPRRPAPAASTSTRPIRRCASRTSRPASWSPARGALAAQEPRHGLGDAARAPLRGGAEEARGGGQRAEARPRPTSAGATRSAPTCCSPTSW